ncbi:hypothetical protein OE88DRAFT_1428806 [Heliocybe sulcata]|uniref:Secreted protein n=1 Tax=Heliocybe sulcata TaxID=5364 RepID=A0A5C3N742_9AGAM|nr:hypothetical protein OE88DRAFT_1428806 [Heliocybe sulcata]
MGPTYWPFLLGASLIVGTTQGAHSRSLSPLRYSKRTPSGGSVSCYEENQKNIQKSENHKKTRKEQKEQNIWYPSSLIVGTMHGTHCRTILPWYLCLYVYAWMC